MKVSHFKIAGLLVITGFTACKKIEVEGQELDVYPIVVEAIMDNNSPVEVSVSQAIALSKGDSLYPPVADAMVQLTAENGDSEILAEGETGYFSGQLTAQPGNSYHLAVQMPDGEITASAMAPADFVEIDTVIAERSADSTISLFCYLTLPEIPTAYLRIKVYIEGFLQEDFLMEKSMGQQAGFLHEINLGNVFAGKPARVEVLTLSKPAYEFYRGMRSNTFGEGFLPSLVKNPPTNLSGGAIGFFNVCLSRQVDLML